MSPYPIHPLAKAIDARQQWPNIARLIDPPIPQQGALKPQALLRQRQVMKAAIHGD